MFCFPLVYRLVKKKKQQQRKNREQSCQLILREMDNFKIIPVKFEHLLLQSTMTSLLT